MPTSILLPLDGSERSTRAGDAALDRAETLVDEAEDRSRDRLAEFADRIHRTGRSVA